MYTRKKCNVSPFLPEYPEQTDVPIIMWETVFNTKNGKTYLLVFGQGIWFGKRMRNSLITPNQCPTFDVIFCDDPTNNYRSIGIDMDGFLVPFHMKGTTCGTMNRAPTDE